MLTHLSHHLQKLIKSLNSLYIGYEVLEMPLHLKDIKHHIMPNVHYKKLNKARILNLWECWF